MPSTLQTNTFWWREKHQTRALNITLFTQIHQIATNNKKASSDECLSYNHFVLSLITVKCLAILYLHFFCFYSRRLSESDYVYIDIDVAYAFNSPPRQSTTKMVQIRKLESHDTNGCHHSNVNYLTLAWTTEFNCFICIGRVCCFFLMVLSAVASQMLPK